MSYDFGSFAAAFVSDPILALIVILTLGATVVNGATDAPNAIATVVGTKAMKPTPAIVMAAICNFVGLAGRMVGTWVLTFPGCGLLAFAFTHLFLMFF